MKNKVKKKIVWLFFLIVEIVYLWFSKFYVQKMVYVKLDFKITFRILIVYFELIIFFQHIFWSFNSYFFIIL